MPSAHATPLYDERRNPPARAPPRQGRTTVAARWPALRLYPGPRCRMRARKTTEEARPGTDITSRGADTIALQRAVEEAEAEIHAERSAASGSGESR